MQRHCQDILVALTAHDDMSEGSEAYGQLIDAVAKARVALVRAQLAEADS